MSAAPARVSGLIAVATVAAVLSAGCTGTPPGSPVSAIPKVIIDYYNNTTSITLASLNADVRYDNLSLVLSNENLTAPLTFGRSFGWALVAETNLTYFVLNASADDGDSFYYYNGSAHIVQRPGNGGTNPPQWQVFIRDTPVSNVQTQSIPYTRLLEQGRL